MARTVATCFFCGQTKPLAKSHAIPDTFFRQLKKERRGTITKIHQHRGVRPTQESGHSPLLCDACEGMFNKRFDDPATSAIRALATGAQAKEFHHTMLAEFICTVLWRANLSKASIYSGYKITDFDDKMISDVVFGRRDPFETFSFEVSQLFDGKRQLSPDDLRKSISAPYRAETVIGAKGHTIHHFHIMGIFLAALIPIVPPMIQDHRYLVRSGGHMPQHSRDIMTLSNFRNIEEMARGEANR